MEISLLNSFPCLMNFLSSSKPSYPCRHINNKYIIIQILDRLIQTKTTLNETTSLEEQRQLQKKKIHWSRKKNINYGFSKSSRKAKLTSMKQVSTYKHYFINNINNKYNISHMFILQLTTAKKSTKTIIRTKYVCQYKVIHIQFKFKIQI